jgi:glutamate 5-kinase
MTAKVDAAWVSASAGVPVVIANGGVSNIVSKVRVWMMELVLAN